MLPSGAWLTFLHTELSNRRSSRDKALQLSSTAGLAAVEGLPFCLDFRIPAMTYDGGKSGQLPKTPSTEIRSDDKLASATKSGQSK